MEAVLARPGSQSWRTQHSPIRRSSKCSKMPPVHTVSNPWSLLRGSKQRSLRQWTKARRREPLHLTCCRGHLFSFNRRVVIERAAALRLPTIYEWPEMAEEGGLIAYGPRLPLMYRQAARLVAKVLQGVKPQDIPVELPSKFDLVVNLATAKALGLTIPEFFLVRADKVIE